MIFVLGPKVRCDLEDIADWIAQDSPERAITMLRELRQQFRRIAGNPYHYRLRPEIGDDARLPVWGRYVLLFRVDGNQVRFERVVYGSRDLPSLFV